MQKGGLEITNLFSWLYTGHLNSPYHIELLWLWLWLTHILAGSYQSAIGDDPKFFHLWCKEDTCGCQQQWVNALQGIASIEPFEENSSSCYYLLPQFQLFTKNLNHWKKSKDNTTCSSCRTVEYNVTHAWAKNLQAAERQHSRYRDL
jgi:hypothetical protein